MIFDGLVAANDRSELRGRLATSWDVSPTERNGPSTSDRACGGTTASELTADDVKFTYDTVIDPNSKPTVAKADYAALQRVDAVDPYTVRFRLSRPNASFLTPSGAGDSSRDISWRARTWQRRRSTCHPVGTRALHVRQLGPGESLVLKRNPDYFGRKPKIDRLIWKIVPDSNVLALQASRGRGGRCAGVQSQGRDGDPRLGQDGPARDPEGEHPDKPPTEEPALPGREGAPGRWPTPSTFRR